MVENLKWREKPLNKKKLFLIVGRTSVGKTTLAKEICRRHGLKLVASYTTRPRRADDADEIPDHIFIDDDEADKLLNDQENIAAYTEIQIKDEEENVVRTNRYFTTKSVLRESDLYVIDPPGIAELKERCADEFELITIYIRVPQRLGIQRAIQRGEKTEDYLARYKGENDRFEEYEKAMDWEYHLLNMDSFDDSIKKFEWILKRELAIHDDK